MNPTSSQWLDVRALPHTREVLVCQDDGLFPVLATTPNGAVTAIVRGGSGHLGLAGRIEATRSFDAGRTWSPTAVIADSDRDDRNAAFGVAAGGALILAYHRQGSYDAEGKFRPLPLDSDLPQPIDVMLTRSNDNGLTWETPVPLGIPSLRAGSPFGKIVAEADGTLLLPIYVHDHTAEGPKETPAAGQDAVGSYLARSRDEGRAWIEPSLIARGMNETALAIRPNGELLAVMRAGDAEAALWSTLSSDGGRTWSNPLQVTGPRRHPADLILLASGDVLLTYGNRAAPYRIEGRVSRDGGRTWLDLLLLFSGPLYGGDADEARRTDLGYPSSAVRRENGRGSGVTMYYVNPSISRSGNWRDETPAGPLYSPHGYRAVAVTWDEEELIARLAQEPR